MKNNWRMIKKARMTENQRIARAWAKAFFAGLLTALLALGVTLLAFSWMLWR